MTYNSCVYQEVYEILSYMNKSDVMKIPIEILEEITDNRNKEYVTQIDPYDIFNLENLNEESIKLLSWLDVNYMISQNKLNELKKIHKKKMMLEEQKKRERYDYKKMFESQKNESNNIIVNSLRTNPMRENEENSLIIPKKISIFEKIKQFIKSKIFKERKK